MSKLGDLQGRLQQSERDSLRRLGNALSSARFWMWRLVTREGRDHWRADR